MKVLVFLRPQFRRSRHVAQEEWAKIISFPPNQVINVSCGLKNESQGNDLSSKADQITTKHIHRLVGLEQ